VIGAAIIVAKIATGEVEDNARLLQRAAGEGRLCASFTAPRGETREMSTAVD
jgi:hypothetical protein